MINNHRPRDLHLTPSEIDTWQRILGVSRKGVGELGLLRWLVHTGQMRCGEGEERVDEYAGTNVYRIGEQNDG